ncbi:hypothetical protein ACHAXR_002543 [Thalassiosira sp. AJA248-18]
MSSENELKRKRHDQARAEPPSLNEQGGHDVTPQNNMMAEMKAMMARMQNEMNSMKLQLNETEGRCHYLEARCGSLERTLKSLAKNQKWVYSAPDIPESHWTELGFDADYINKMHDFINRLKNLTCALRGGEHVNKRLGHGNSIYLKGGWDDDNQGPMILRHDSLLLPHWTELADALHLCDGFDGSGTLIIQSFELVHAVLDMMAMALKTKKFKSFELNENPFVDVTDGINFAIQFAQDHPDLERFSWMRNPIESMDDVNNLLGCINRHPSLSEVHLKLFCGAGVNGYSVLCSLLTGNGNFKSIDLESNGIRTMGGTHLPDFLASNPPLEQLCLIDNHLDDNDAILIAEALKHNTNLQRLYLGDNEMTGVGFGALEKVVFDSTSLNSAANSNHSCLICGTDSGNYLWDPQSNKEDKICSLLSSRNEKQNNVYHLDSEFGEGSLKLVPKVLECVNNYSRRYTRIMDGSYGKIPRNVYFREDGDVELVRPLSIMYEILRSWNMPGLYESNRMAM